MKTSSKRLLSIILSLLLVVVAFIIFFDLIDPEYANIQQTKGQIVGENGVYQTESQAVAAAQKVISEYQQQEQSQGGGTIALALPTDEDLAGAIAQIYGLAENNGLLVQSLAIGAPSLQLQATPASGAPAVATTNPIGDFSFQITVLGSYENFKNFISGVETNVRLFDVKSMTIAPESNAVSSGKITATAGEDFFDYNLTIETYYQTTKSQ